MTYNDKDLTLIVFLDIFEISKNGVLISKS